MNGVGDNRLDGMMNEHAKVQESMVGGLLVMLYRDEMIQYTDLIYRFNLFIFYFYFYFLGGGHVLCFAIKFLVVVLPLSPYGEYDNMIA